MPNKMTPEERLLWDIFGNRNERGIMIETNKFARKPFYVDAVQVTAENMDDVSAWCQGTVTRTDLSPQGDFIKVRVHRPLTERQTKAFVGDWVLYAGTGFKVYTDKAFEKSFEPATETREVEHSRDTETGQYVSDEEAASDPEGTVTETDDVEVAIPATPVTVAPDAAPTPTPEQDEADKLLAELDES